MENTKKEKKILLLGATGQVGSAVLRQLLSKNVVVSAIVRSPQKISEEILKKSNLTLVKGSFLDMTLEELIPHMEEVESIICCLGKGGKKAFSGTPNLLEKSLKHIHNSVKSLNNKDKIRLTFLSSAGIDNPSGIDQNRSLREKFTQWFSSLISSHIRDYNNTMNYLHNNIGIDNQHIEWTVVRPTFFKTEPVSPYKTLESGKGYLSEKSSVENMADFHCQLMLNDEEWNKWVYKMPVIYDKNSSKQQ